MIVAPVDGFIAGADKDACCNNDNPAASPEAPMQQILK